MVKELKVLMASQVLFGRAMVLAHVAAPEKTVIEKPQDLRTELVGLKLSQMSAPAEFAAQIPAFRQRVARSFEGCLLHRQHASEADLEDAANLLLELAELGAYDIPATEEDLASVMADQLSSTARLLRTFALVPAWQSAAAPLSEVPTWLLPLCAAYHFAGPRLISVDGQAEAFARDYLHALVDLARLAGANRGSASVRAAVDCFLRAPQISPSWAGSLWPEVAAARCRLFSALKPSVSAVDAFPLPREGRRLRVVVIAPALSSQGLGASLVPLLERIDRSRFELIVVSSDVASVLSTHLKNRGAELLPLETVSIVISRMQTLMADVVVFAAESGKSDDLVYELSRQRLAPLQIWYDGLHESPGVPAIDLFLAGELCSPISQSVRAPRLALLPGVGSLRKNDLNSSAGDDLSREAVGLGEEKLVLVSFAPFCTLRPENLRSWGRVLARVPEAIMLLCQGGEAAEGDWLQRFCAQVDQIVVAEGGRADQVVVAPAPLASYESRKCVLALADIVLEAYDHSEPEAVLAAAECGVPVVARRLGPGRHQRAAALLQAADLGELVADSVEQYEEIVSRLAADVVWRGAQAERVAQAAPRWLAAHDSFALSEAFGCILEKAFDAIASDRRAFSGNGAPFRGTERGEIAAALAEAHDLIDLGITTEGAKRARFVMAADGAHPVARGLIARALQLDGQHDLAANLLVSQLELNPLTADAFYQVALASFNAGFAANALDALKTALGLDAQHLDSLLLLARFDNADLGEIAAVLTKIAPDDPRVQQLLSDCNATGAVKS